METHINTVQMLTAACSNKYDLIKKGKHTDM